MIRIYYTEKLFLKGKVLEQIILWFGKEASLDRAEQCHNGTESFFNLSFHSASTKKDMRQFRLMFPFGNTKVYDLDARASL